MTERSFEKHDLQWFQRIVERYPFPRRIDSIHLHHTWKPRKSEFAGEETIVGIWSYHVEKLGWSDIAQHLTIDPDGGLWPGRAWDLPPASATGFNGNGEVGPFMIEMIGDFDLGRDALEDEQRKAVVSVIATLQEKLDLPRDAVRFHNEMSTKSCPGSGVDKAQLLREVKAARTRLRSAAPARGAAAGPFLRWPGDHEQVAALIAGTSTRAAREADGEVPEGWAGRAAVARESVARGDKRPDLTGPELHEIEPFVVNLRRGRLSQDGDFKSTETQVRAIFDRHLEEEAAAAAAEGRPLRLVFYAHGGLNKEQSALRQAHDQYKWWRANRVYPIFFVWETGLGETLRDILFRGQRGVAARGFFEDLKNSAIERLGRLVGDRVWSGMKNSAAAAVDPVPPNHPEEGGGARFVAEQLRAFAAAHQGQLEVHAIGHSAGSNFHSHFVPALLEGGAVSLRSLTFLAPAVSIRDYRRRLDGLLGHGIDSLNLFALDRPTELADHAGPYSAGSLLWLVSRALEEERDMPLLGMEEYLRRDTALRARFGLGAPPQAPVPVGLVFSPSPSDVGRNACRARQHGAFDNNPPTMNAVALRILGLDQPKPPVPFEDVVPEVSIVRALDEEGEIEELRRTVLALISAPTAGPAMLAAPAAVSAPLVGAPPLSAPTTPVVAAASGVGLQPGGRRRALTIAVDDYPDPDDRLSGCVGDADAWTETLGGLGFEVIRLTDGDATRNGILAGIGSLLRQAAPGDSVVIHYSGHGTNVEDLDGDEEDDGRDEALCPVDFRTGAVLIDDDLRGVLDELPAGVALTVLLDCCHSGTATRVAASRSRTRPGGRARFVRPSAQLDAAHRAFRSRAGRAAGARGAEGIPIRWVNFSACLPHELALEHGGLGDFTRLATGLLRQGASGLTVGEFQRRILQAFGPQPAQTPLLDPTGAADLPLFGAAVDGRSVAGPRSGSAAAGDVAALLRIAAGLLQGSAS